MMPYLDRLFPPPPAPKREKPEEILYGIDDRPPATVLLSVGVQHVLLALMFAIYAVLAGRGIGLDESDTAHFVGSTLFVIGLGTVLQAVRSRFTPGVLFVGKMNDAKWRRADMSLVSRTMITFSFTNMLHGITGTLTSGSSSANIA